MLLYNPTKSEQRFYYGHIPYVFKPNESRTLDDNVAVWALKRGNRNLVEYNASYDREMTSTDMVYEEMPWKKLVSIASARKIFKPGTPRKELEALLKEYDTETGTLQESFNQEEGEGS